MATDIDAIKLNIEGFYDFTGKSVIHVGAGGGQFVDYAVNTREVLAVDPDPEAVARLKTALRDHGLEGRFRVIQGVFESVSEPADVVFFEFCLHEIEDPAAALGHARSLAPETLVVDHAPESPWSWYACETEKVERSWAAVRRQPMVRDAAFTAVQRFGDYPELVARFEELGEPALIRIREFADRRDIEIEMPYAMALLSAQRA